MVPPASHRVSRVPWYSGAARPASDFVYGAFTLSGGVSQTPSAIVHCTFWRSTTPSCMHDGLGSLPFARRYLGDRCFFLFLCLLRCFSSAGSPPKPMYSTQDNPKGLGFPIRISPDQRSLSTPRSFSQTATSFIACDRQGIHHMHLFT